MPLTKKGAKIMDNMKNEYGKDKGKSVFFASKNKGIIKGVESPVKGKATGTKDQFGNPIVKTKAPKK